MKNNLEKVVNARLDKATYQELTNFCCEENISISDFIRETIKNTLKKEERNVRIVH